MRIAIVGARGMSVPGRTFGGFETFIAGLAPRLAARRHEVTVYSRAALYAEHPSAFRGVKLRWLPAIEGKILGTPTHTLLAMADAVRHRFDAILIVNPGNALQCLIPRLLTRARLVMNVDGIEWNRGKWGRFGRWYFKASARAATRICHAVVADSNAIADYYAREFHTTPVFVPYAFDPREPRSPAQLRTLGLEPKGYYLVVGRLIPENNVEYIVKEFSAGPTSRRLVVVGGANYESAFHRRLASFAGERVRFLGHVDDMDLLWDLFGHAYAYVHGHSVGGTNPALLQAMAAKACPIVFDVVFNREVAGEAAVPFSLEPGHLAEVVRSLDGNPEEVARRGALALGRLTAHYSWDLVVERYEAVLAGPHRGMAR